MQEESDNPLLDGLPLLGDLPDLDGASVLVRVDFNVPLRPCAGEPATVTDDFRIRAALPTLDYLLGRGASVTACTHLGRPEGPPTPGGTSAPVREELARLAPQVELLENLRFDPGEEQNDPAFVEKLVNGHDAYVNDAFGVSHRRHASVVGPPSRPARAPPASCCSARSRRWAGCSGSRLDPFVAVVGGAKVADKLGVLEALLDRVDALVVGGGMAFTFLAAAGHGVGASLVDRDRIGDCAALLASGNAHPPAHRHRRPRAGRRLRVRLHGGRGPDRRVPTSPTGGRASTSGPSHRRVLRPRDRHGRHGPVERADGGVRGRPLQRRDQGRCPGDGGERRVHRRRRWGQRRRDRRAGTGRPDRLHLHRRGSVARAARVRRPPRPGRAARRGQRPAGRAGPAESHPP